MTPQCTPSIAAEFDLYLSKLSTVTVQRAECGLKSSFIRLLLNFLIMVKPESDEFLLLDIK